MITGVAAFPTFGKLLAPSDQNSEFWSLPIPAGTEGVYDLELRTVDQAGLVQVIHGAWRGEIDNYAPRVTAANVMISLGRQGGNANSWNYFNYANYSAIDVSDNNLRVDSYQGSNPAWEDAAWYTQLVGGSQGRLKRIVGCLQHAQVSASLACRSIESIDQAVNRMLTQRFNGT